MHPIYTFDLTNYTAYFSNMGELLALLHDNDGPSSSLLRALQPVFAHLGGEIVDLGDISDRFDDEFDPGSYVADRAKLIVSVQPTIHSANYPFAE